MLAVGLAATAVLVPATANGIEYPQAKQMADGDEAKLDGAQMASLAQAQANFARKFTRKCAAGKARAELSPFGLVLKLDADGHVVHGWVDTETTVATCMRDAALGQLYFKPPQAPFMTALQMTWSP
ncbi:hypothetical protein GCM10027432_22470 [Lysobacter fragariae]